MSPFQGREGRAHAGLPFACPVPLRAAVLLASCVVTWAHDSTARAQTTAYTDPCLRCDVIYASDCGLGLWAIDTSTGVSTLVGTLPDNLYDLAVTSDGRLVGATNAGTLIVVSACDASGTPLPSPFVGNGLAGDLNSTDLFSQGPPLVRCDSTGTGASTTVGGATGGAPPAWCGSSLGDLAMDPGDGLLRTALGCSCATFAADLEIVDPATGDVVRDAGCMNEASGVAHSSVYGLAFDSSGTLWACEGISAPQLLRVDPDNGAVLAVVPISGGFDCGFGLASVPCLFKPPDPCNPPPPPPVGMGASLRVTNHGDPHAPDITALLAWPTDPGAPRPPDNHFHVQRGDDPRVFFVSGPEPLRATSWTDSTPAAAILPFCHFYLVYAADQCEQQSSD